MLSYTVHELCETIALVLAPHKIREYFAKTQLYFIHIRIIKFHDFQLSIFNMHTYVGTLRLLHTCIYKITFADGRDYVLLACMLINFAALTTYNFQLLYIFMSRFVKEIL